MNETSQEERNQHIRDAYRKGMRTKAICQKFRCGPKLLYSLIPAWELRGNETRIRQPYRKTPHDLAAKIRAEYQETKTPVKALAEKYGISKYAVRQAVNMQDAETGGSVNSVRHKKVQVETAKPQQKEDPEWPETVIFEVGAYKAQRFPVSLRA